MYTIIIRFPSFIHRKWVCTCKLSGMWEAYGYWVQQFRRLMGVTIVREFARPTPDDFFGHQGRMFHR